jgi:hypothetical protein
MWHPRIAPVAVSFSLVVLFTLPDTAFGQHVRRGGLRGHVGGPAVRGGAFVRPGRLMGTTRGAVGPLMGPIRRGFPDHGLHGGLFVFPGNGLGFFGFPHHHPGFFFFSGFGFFSGFPFFDSFLGFDGFPGDRVGLFRVPKHRSRFTRFRDRRFEFIEHQSAPVGGFLGWTPYFGISTAYAYPYASAGDASAGGAYVAETTTTRDISQQPALGRQLAAPGIATGDSLVVERVSVMDIVPRTVLRLTWRNHGLAAAQVALFLADTAQGVLSGQTLRSPPFTALFEPPAGTAFVGMTVVWPDGTLSTRFVPYWRRAR